jgi:hypothetical protein
MTTRHYLCAIALCASVSACGQAHSGAVQEIRVPEGMGYPLDARHLSADSMTAMKLKALAGAAAEIADSLGVLPTSMEAILSLRRKTVHLSPTTEWAVDGWGHPFVVVLHADRKSLLIQSYGQDGSSGGGDDMFEIVRLRQ